MHTIALLLLLLVVALCHDCQAAKKAHGYREKYRTRKYRHKDNSANTCELEIKCHGGGGGGAASVAAGGYANGGVKTVPVSLPIRGPRGPPGREGERGLPGQDGLPGTPGIVAANPHQKKIAFFVSLTSNLGPFHKDTDIKFDHVITNVGSAYDAATGRFTSPLNATYQFNVVISAQGRQKAGVAIMKNEQMVATVWAESIPFWGSASNIMVLSLRRGDTVRLRLLNRASYLHGYMYSTFSGFLIFEN